MKKKWMLMVAIGLGVVSAAADLSGGKPQTDRDVVQELRTQIVELRAKVQTLEGRVQSLESRIDQLKSLHSLTPLSLQAPARILPVPSPSAVQPPTIWGQGKVNGWTYYIVPCKQD